MKRIPLVTLLVVALAMVLAGCGLLSQKTEPTSSAPPVKEVKMVHPSGIPVLMYHKIGDFVIFSICLASDNWPISICWNP